MKYFIHPGLPKTGTTFLQQCCFPYVGESTIYLGKHGDPSLNDDLYRILQASTSRSTPQMEPLRDAMSKAEQRLYGVDLKRCVYSDEMIFVDSGGVRWQDKVQQLGDLMSGRDVELILSVRHPQDALYSLFVELLPTLPRSSRTPEAFLSQSNQALIFRFRALSDVIGRAFPSASIRWLPFEAIPQLTEDHSVFRGMGVSRIEHRRVNEKAVDKSGDYFSNSTSLRSLGARLPLRRQMRAAIPPSLWDRLVRDAQRIKLGSGVKVDQFSPELRTWIAREFEDDVAFMAVEHGVNLEARSQ